MNILLTSAGRRTYLVEYFKEALKMAGQPGMVHAANSQASPACYAADRWVATPLIYDEQYSPFLMDYCQKWKIRLLIPLFDIDIPVLAAHREEFAAIGTIVVTADRRMAEVCNDKWKTHGVLLEEYGDELLKAGLRIPKTWLDLSLAASRAREGAVSYPLMIKPRWGMGSLSIYQADDEEELRLLARKSQKEIFRSYLKYEAAQAETACVLIQEKLKGQEYGLDIINDLDGNYRTTIVKRKVAMRSGETDAAETVEDPVLLKIGAVLGGIVKHRGNLDVDVFACQGEYYLLEMNARFGGGYPFSHAAGIHLPYALVCWAMGKEPEEQYLKARIGVKARKDIRIQVWKSEDGE